MPNYGYGGLYQPNYLSQAEQSAVMTKQQQSGPQATPQNYGGPSQGPSALPTQSPYALDVGASAQAARFDEYKKSNPAGYQFGPGGAYGGGGFSNGYNNRPINLDPTGGQSAANIYGSSYYQGGVYVPTARDTFGDVNTVQFGRLNNEISNPTVANANRNKRLVSFEDLRSQYQGAMLDNSLGGKWYGQAANNNLSVAYNNLVSKMKASGQFGLQGNYNQRTGYTPPAGG